MPDKREHRGPHPEDQILFAPDAWPSLREATADLCWLLSRNYPSAAALKLVGDRFQLAQRQRLAVARCACGDQARKRRLDHRLEMPQIRGKPLLLDGYNVLTSIEAALSGGVILSARDTCYRDMASMHGTYRKVQETIPALRLLGDFTAKAGVTRCCWYLDSPVSNSGRLKTFLLQIAAESGWDWTVELVHNPDTILAESPEIIATADSEVLNRAAQWINLAREIIDSSVPNACIVDLS